MAKSSDHIALASKNQIALSTLIRDQPNHSEWIVIISFALILLPLNRLQVTRLNTTKGSFDQ